jgi:arsenate reductase
MQAILYGIPNCSTVKKARDWLDHRQISYEFYDFKKQGVSENLINNWLSEVNIEQLINRSGMTFRNLDASEKAQASSISTAIPLMISKPSMIRRPILQISNQVYLGFQESTYESIFNL